MYRFYRFGTGISVPNRYRYIGLPAGVADKYAAWYLIYPVNCSIWVVYQVSGDV